MPWEQVQEKGILYVGVFGVKGEIEIPTNFVSMAIYDGSAGDNAPPPPTLDVYMQILDQLRLTREYTQGQADIATTKAELVVEKIKQF